jgi:parvulin-like peptidyl-prolyl isomerase
MGRVIPMPKPTGPARAAAVAAALLLLAACGGPTPNPSPAPPDGATAQATGAASAVPASPTTEPLAARVNGVPVPLALHQRAVARCEAAELALGHDPAQANCAAGQLNELIERVLIDQAAATLGVRLSDGDVDAQLQAMQAESGPERFQDWLTENQYGSAEELRADLRAQLLGAAVFVQVTASVSETVEQVHARHILVASAPEAQNLLAQLQGGADFAELARQFTLDDSTRATGGDLGFFYRGLLTVPELEKAAFELQPAETSGVVASTRGFHIVQVLERDPQRPLVPEDLQRIRQQAFERWLAERRAGAQIETFVPTGS